MGQLRYKLTQAELNAALKGRYFDEQTQKIARQLFVCGASPTALATEFDISRSRIYDIRNTVWAAHLEKRQYPPHWIEKTVIAPPELFDVIEEQVEAALQEWQTKLISIKMQNEM